MPGGVINSRQYEWADLSLTIGTRDITGIRGVKYNEKIEREPVYAKGRYPHSIQSGNVGYEGEFTMLQSELEVLVASGNGSILNLKGLNCICSYGDPLNGDAITTDIIEGVYFTVSEKDIKQGDKFMEVKVPFVALRIRNQAA